MPIDPRIPLAAVPQQNAFEAFTQGEQMRHQSQLMGMKRQKQQNAMAMQAGQMLAQGVLSAEDPARAYPLALQQAGRFFDVSQLPQQWGPEAEMFTRMFAMPEKERTDFMRAMEMIPPEQRQQAAMVKLGLAPGASDPAVWEQKAMTMIANGVPPQRAWAIASGQINSGLDPVSRQPYAIDLGTTPIGGASTGGAGVPEPQPSRGSDGVADESLYERADEATGVVPTLKEWSTDVPGQLPGELGEAFQFPETVEDRQAFRTAAGKMFRAMSVNPKMPVAEINRIREQFKIEPGMWTSPTGLRARMQSIDESLRTTLQEQRQLASDPSMPAEARKSAAENAAAIQDFLREMGVPEGGAAPAGQGAQGNLPRPKSKAEVENLPSGSLFLAPDGTVRRKP